MAPITYFISDNTDYEVVLSDNECSLKESMESSINSVESDATRIDGTWYTLSGTKLDGKPTAKGIYICNGRKIVIK